MTKLIVKTLFAAALPLLTFAGAAQADDPSAVLLATCQKSEAKPETCECQVKAIVDNSDPRYVQVLAYILSHEADIGTPEGLEKVTADALAAAGITQEEYTKLEAEAQAKAGPLADACKA